MTTSTTQQACDLCGLPIINPERDAISGLKLDPIIVGGEAVRHSHLSCYRLNRHILEMGLDPRDYR